MQLKHQLVAAFVMLSCSSLLLGAQGYTVARTGAFAPQNKKVLLLQNPAGQKPIILFQTTLRVNTVDRRSRIIRRTCAEETKRSTTSAMRSS